MWWSCCPCTHKEPSNQCCKSDNVPVGGQNSVLVYNVILGLNTRSMQPHSRNADPVECATNCVLGGNKVLSLCDSWPILTKSMWSTVSSQHTRMQPSISALVVNYCSVSTRSTNQSFVMWSELGRTEHSSPEFRCKCRRKFTCWDALMQISLALKLLDTFRLYWSLCRTINRKWIQPWTISFQFPNVVLADCEQALSLSDR